jgi:hypothetical protein
VVVGAHIILVQLLHSLLKRPGDCDSEGLQGHLRGHTHAYAYAYAMRLIAIMPHGDRDGFCLAGIVAVYAVHLGPLKKCLAATWLASAWLRRG